MSEPQPPNLLIAGVQKGGTTWLHQMLARHPDVFMTSVKELNYFNRRDLVRSADAWAAYLAHFEEAGTTRIRGESTPHYFWVKDEASPFSPRPRHDNAEEIDRRLGSETQIVVVLRHPVDRAVSAAHHNFARGRIGRTESIWDASVKLGLVDLGFYGRHLPRWLSVFGTGRFHVMLYDDLVSDPRRFVADLASRIGVAPSETWLDALDLGARINDRAALLADHREDGESYQGIASSDRERLAELYRHDIEAVEALLGREVWTAGHTSA